MSLVLFASSSNSAYKEITPSFQRSVLITTFLSIEPAVIVHINISEALAQLGQKVELRCLSDGDPIPTVTWYKPDGSELVTNTAFDNTVFVDITSNDDFGEYRCLADNGLGPPVERIVAVGSMYRENMSS